MTERITLRPLQRSDEQALYHLIAASLPQLQQFLAWAKEWTGHGAVRQYLQEVSQAQAAGQQRVWLICCAHQPVGVIDLHSINEQTRQAEMGYWVATAATGRGLATAAGQQVLQYAQALKLRQIVLLVDARNHASKRVAHKLGFTQRRVLTNHSKTHQMLEFVRAI